MPYALIVIGLAMIVTAANNTHVQLATQLRSDGTAFLKYLVAFGIVGSAGYVDSLRVLSRTFMLLIVLAMILANSKTGRGFFGNLQDAITQGPATIPAAPEAPSTSGANIGNILGGADPLASQQSGLFGQAPANSGQAKFNGWMNYFLGGNWTGG